MLKHERDEPFDSPDAPRARGPQPTHIPPSRTWCTIAIAVSFGVVCMGESVDRPLATRLRDQQLVARSPAGETYDGFMMPSMIVRGYEAVYVSVDPGDTTRGTRWVAYDSGQERITTLISDLNTVCGEPARAGKLGQRLHAIAERGALLGTGPAPGDGDYPGGHVIRRGKGLGKVEPGWAVVAFDQRWRNTKRRDGTRRGRGEYGLLALARSPDGKRFRIYHVDVDKVEYLGIEGGPELRGFYGEGGYVVFPAGGEGKLMRKAVNEDQPAESYTPRRRPAKSFVAAKPREEPTAVPEGVRPRQFDTRSIGREPGRHFKNAKREDLLAAAHIHQPYSCFARNGVAPDQPAEVFLHRPSAGDPMEVCALEPFDGQVLDRVYRLRFMGSGDLAVLAGNGKVTVLQIYENPLLDAICAVWNALMDEAHAGEPIVKARYLGSLYDLSEYADRGFDPPLLASDGRVYFGTMPHHSSESGPIFCFDPKASKTLLVGHLDDLAGVKRPDAVPTMMHGNPFEMNGKAYFTGQDPHYGGWGFPVEQGRERPRFRGSPILEYDLKTRKARGLGIPVPGDNSLFRIAGDPERNILYVRRGYHRGWGLIWYRLQLDEAGDIAGKPVRLPFGDVHPSDILVAADGSLFGGVPHTSYSTWSERRKKREKTDDIKPKCELVRYYPDSGRKESVATFDGVWDIHALPWQHGKPSVLIMAGNAMYRLDTRAAALKKLWDWPKAAALRHKALMHRGKTIYCLARANSKKRFARRTCAVYTVDIKSGKVLYHGLVVDDAGRRPKDLNHFLPLADGRIFAVGTAYGLPTDRHGMPRYRDSEPFRLDSASFLIDRLPPGRPLEAAK